MIRLQPLLLMLLPFLVDARNPAFAPVEEDSNLPRVLLIGDSISIGYTLTVRESLQGKANVLRIPTNAGHTGMGLQNLGNWIDPKLGKWDVIHFNWGLWDLCYRNPKSKTQGNRDKINGSLTHTPEQYAENLEQIVQQLKKTGAMLIFATTTPVPEGEAGRKVEDARIYNQVAMKVMKKHGVAINDLYTVMEPVLNLHITEPGNVHFKPEGSRLLGEQVARAILECLEK